MTHVDAPIENPVSFREGVRGVFQRLQSYRTRLGFLFILGLVSAAANGTVPYVTGRFFDALIGLSRGDASSSTSFPLWALMLTVWATTQVIANAVDWVMDRSRRTIDSRLQSSIQSEGFIHLLRLPLSYHTHEHINAVVSKISTASWRVTSLTEQVIQVAPQLLSVLIGIVLAASISVPMAGVLAVGVLLYIVLLSFILRPVALMEHTTQEFWSSAWDDASSAINQSSYVKQASAEEYETEKIQRDFNEKVPALWYSVQKIWSNVSFFQRAIVFLTQLTVFILSAHAVAIGTMTVGDLIALNGYAMLFFGPFVALGHSWQTLQNGLTSAGLLQRIFNEKEELYHPANAKHEGIEFGAVRFDEVTFKYESDQAPILAHLSFTAEPGQVVALVGESGVGKSSAISLISGYYFPSEGSVMVDGVDTREWDLLALRSKIAVVPQEVALFNDTIRANIRYGAFSATDAQVEEAAREAHIHDFIEKQAKGYDTLVGERGIKLSVGQKQRIAIARAILRNPEFLILDEPTSALDIETEQLITASLDRLMRGRTTFIVAHRLSTIRKADKILVIKDGAVAEEGTHAELASREGGIYRHLYDLHVGLYE